MWAQDATKYRPMMGRCNFLWSRSTRPALAANQASRWMAKPCYNDMEKVIRIAKYLNGGHRRLQHRFPFGPDNGMIYALSGSAWVGSPRTCRTTSGGVLCVGSCTINHRSSTQSHRFFFGRGWAIRRHTSCHRSEGPEVALSRGWTLRPQS